MTFGSLYPHRQADNPTLLWFLKAGGQDIAQSLPQGFCRQVAQDFPSMLCGRADRLNRPRAGAKPNERGFSDSDASPIRPNVPHQLHVVAHLLPVAVERGRNRMLGTFLQLGIRTT